MIKKTKLRIISLLLILGMSLIIFKNTPAVFAGSLTTDLGGIATGAFTGVSTWGKWLTDLGVSTKKVILENLVVAYKIAALMVVQQTTQLIIGSGTGQVISNYNNYLYISPQQRAMAQMNSFFTGVSAGRSSGLNYEGIGPNYDAYLRAQAMQAISGQIFATDIQQIVSDPRQMFSTGNMKGVMSFFGNPANNPYGYVMTSQSKYNAEFAKAQDIARSEQDRGFLPTKTSSGMIKQPAALLQNALMQVDQIGTQLIMNAKDDSAAGIGQIAAGAGISVASRAVNYYTASDAGKAQIQAKNDEFPFSLGYSTAGGLGINAGGVSASTGVGSLGTNAHIGNTAINGNLTCSGAGCQVTSSTRIDGDNGYSISGNASGTRPSVNIIPPSFSCTTDASCNEFVPGSNPFKCNSSKKCVYK